MANTNIPNLSKPKSIVSIKKTQDVSAPNSSTNSSANSTSLNTPQVVQSAQVAKQQTPVSATNKSIPNLSKKPTTTGFNFANNSIVAKNPGAKSNTFNFVSDNSTNTKFDNKNWDWMKDIKPITFSDSSKNYDSNAIQGIGYSLLGSTIDTVGKAADFLAGGAIRTAGDIKIGVDAISQLVGKGKISDPYVKEISKAIRSGGSLIDKAKKVYDVSMLRNYDSLTGSYEGTSNIPIISDFKKQTSDWTKNTVYDLNKKSDLQDESSTTQWIANMAGSIPYTLISRLPYGTGALLNFGTSTMQGIEQKTKEYSPNGKPLTMQQKLDIMNYAVGSAAVNAGTEQIFPAGKGAINLGKAVASGAVKSIVKESTKFLIKQGAQEATEEGLSYIGQGLIAKLSTNTKDNLFGVASGSALVNLADLGTTMGSAFVMGVAFSGVGLSASGISSKIANKYDGFVNTKKAYEEVKDVPLDQITPEQIQNAENAIKKDLKSPENKAAIQQAAKESVAKSEVSLPVGKQVEMYQNILQQVYSDDTTAMTDSELSSRNEYISNLNEKTSNLKESPTIITSDGKKYSVSQIEGFKKSYDDQVAFYKNAMNSVESPALKNSVQGDLDFAISQSNKYKKLLDTQGNSKTPAELLNDLEASRSPLNESAFENDKYTTKAAESSSTVTSASFKADSNDQIKEVVNSKKSVNKITETSGKTILDSLANTPDAFDSTGTNMGILPKGFSDTRSKQQVPDYGMSDEMKESMKKTSDFSKNKKGLRDIVESVKKWTGNPNYGSVEVSNKYGDFKRAIRLSRASHAVGSNIAVDVIAKSYGTLSTVQLDVFKKSLTFFDIKENIQKGLYADSFVPLPHGAKSVSELETVIANIEKIYNSQENEPVRKAAEIRKKLLGVLQDEVIAAGKKVGKDYSYIKSRDFYVYNAAYEMYVTENKNKVAGSNPKYLTRTGKAKDYISNPVISDYLIFTKLAKDKMKLEVLSEVVALDISKNIEYDKKTGERIIPEGYVSVGKNEIIGNIEATNALENNAVTYAKEMMDQQGISKDSEVGKNILENAHKLEKDATIVIPEEIYNAVTEEYMKKQSNQFANLYKKVYHLWKFSKIRTPFVAWKYNFRNTIGDLEMTFAGNTKAILKVPRAMHELWQYFYKGNRENKNIMNFLSKTGGVSGMSIQTLGELEKIPELSFLKNSATPKDYAKHIAKKAWGALTLEKFTNYREQVLRYAAYLQIKQDISKNNGKVKDYIASSREEIDSIRSTDDKAIKLSNDLLGAYDDVSKVGRTIADNFVPFFRFQEISVKRYVRMTQNAFYSDGQTINKTGYDYAKRAGNLSKTGAVGIMRLGKILIKTGLFYSAIAAFNAAFTGDDEDKLSEDVKNQPHIIFPSWLFGDTSRVYYLSNIGIFSQLLGTAGLDYGDGELIRDVFTGKKTWDEATSEISLGFNPYQAIMGVDPIFVSAFELATGKKGYYYDPENPSEMRDRWVYIFDQAGFGPVYTYLAKLPANESTYTSAFANSVAKGDSAMWAVYDMTDAFYSENNIAETGYSSPKRGTTEWKKKNAAYYYKVALRLNDAAAIEKYLAEFISYGGTRKSLDSSVQSLKPLNYMPKKYKEQFIAQLTDEEKATLNNAFDYYNEILAKHVSEMG